MNNLRFNLSIYRRLIGIKIRSQLQYRVSFVLESISTMITMSMFFLALAFTFQRFDNLGGWSLGEVAFLWGLVEISFGLMDMVFSGFDPQNFGRQVRQGAFDQLLLRPVNITTQVFGSEFVLRRLGRMAQGALVFGIALSLAPITWTALKVLYLPVVVLSMVLFFGGLFIIGATITFWTVESIEAMNILTYGSSELIAYPMHIYGDGLRRIFTLIVPAIFLNYYPALYFLDKPDPLGGPPILSFLSPLVGVGVLTVALLFWRYGIQHYQSTGS